MKSSLYTVAIVLIISVSSCLRDDFDKLSQSTWNPDISIPIVNSNLTVDDILIQDKSPTEIIPDITGLVRIIYNSNNFSDRAENIIVLPNAQNQQSINLNQQTLQNFQNNQSIGAQVNNSSSFQFQYPLNNQLGSTTQLDTVFFKEGNIELNLSSFITHNASFTVVIPNLFVENQPFTQTIFTNSTGNLPSPASLIKDLSGAFLVLNSNENVLVAVETNIERTNSSSLPNSNAFSISTQFNETKFSRLSGFMGNFQMPLITNDTLQVRLFKNAISATNLVLESASTSINVINSTGMPVNYNLNNVIGFRNTPLSPSLDLSAYNFPASINEQENPGSGANVVSYLYNESNSNLLSIINQFPKFFTKNDNYSLNGNSFQSSFLLDTSAVRINQRLELPLNGVTLDLEVRDTFDFKFEDISREIESILLRLNTTNGFPLSGFLQVYFVNEDTNNPFQPITIIDSLYTAGNQIILDAPSVNASGEATNEVNQITDAIINKQKWIKLRDNQSNQIIVRGRLTTSNLGLDEVRVLETNSLNIRIGARFQLSTTF